MFGWNEASFFVFLGCVLTYTILLIIATKKGKFSNRLLLTRIYKDWVDARIDDLSHIVTIQTIRNSILSNTGFITALLVFLGLIINIYDNPAGIFNRSQDFFGSITISIGIMQISLIAAITVFSLFNFTFSVRMLQRAQLLITSNTKKREEIFEDTYNLMQKSFSTAQNHWMSGIRGLYYLVPSLIWLYHPIAFLITTVLITLYLVGWHDLSFFSGQNRVYKRVKS